MASPPNIGYNVIKKQSILLIFSLIFFISPILSMSVNLNVSVFLNVSHMTLSLLAHRLMGVCLCICACAWGCWYRVPSSISRLPLSDGHWSSISTRGPDWCCTILSWKAWIVVVHKWHAYYNTFAPQKGEIAMLMPWGSDLHWWWAQKRSKIMFVCKCSMSLSKNNVLENGAF